jgi:hypothetical protein
LRGSGKCAGNDQGRSQRGGHKATRDDMMHDLVLCTKSPCAELQNPV